MLTIIICICSFITSTAGQSQYAENPIGAVYGYVGESVTLVCDLQNINDSYPIQWFRDYPRPRIYLSSDSEIYVYGIPYDIRNRLNVVCNRGDHEKCELIISSLQITDTGTYVCRYRAAPTDGKLLTVNLSGTLTVYPRPIGLTEAIPVDATTSQSYLSSTTSTKNTDRKVSLKAFTRGRLTEAIPVDASTSSSSATCTKSTGENTESFTASTDRNPRLIIIILSVVVSGLCVMMMVVVFVCKMTKKSLPGEKPQQKSVNKGNMEHGGEYTELNMKTMDVKEEYKTLTEVRKERGTSRDSNYDYAYADLKEAANAAEDNDVYEINLDSDKEELKTSAKVFYVNCQRPIKAQNFFV